MKRDGKDEVEVREVEVREKRSGWRRERERKRRRKSSSGRNDDGSPVTALVGTRPVLGRYGI